MMTFRAMVVLAVLCVSAARAQKPVMSLVVDETQEARRIAFVHETIPVKPGVVELAYPKWIPGEHGPTGPIQNVATITVHAGEKRLEWTRDPDDIFSIKVKVPAGVSEIAVGFDTLLENTISDKQIYLVWSTTVLYPRGIDKRELMIEPSVILPAGWKQGSSLKVASEADGKITFAPTSLERLIDSSMLAGEYLKSVQLASKWPAELDFTSDSQKGIDSANDAKAFEIFGKLVDQDQAMFGFRHWEKFHILVSQSNERMFDGLEHEDSPYNGIPEGGLGNKAMLEAFGGGLLAHEQSHSWDGKYRRAAEMYSKADYQGPERTSLLWVYEGLNQYISYVLATRSGFNDKEYTLDHWANTASEFAYTAGRAATPLVDTATENWVLRSTPRSWSTLRRSQDYYDEGALMWMHADAIIRAGSGDKLSLDDFLKRFLGEKDTPPIVHPYTRADVEASLNATFPYDWHSFLEKYVYQVNSAPPTDGLEAAGWKLVYTEKPSAPPIWASLFPGGSSYSAVPSLGMVVSGNGTISDVVPGSPAYEAGLGPGMVVMGVEGRKYSSDVLEEAIAKPKDGKISVIVKSFDEVKTVELKYAGGVKYPHLEKIPGAKDYLTEILTAK